MKIIQPLPRRYEWRSLVLLVDGERGTLRWTWPLTLSSEHLLETVRSIRVHGSVAAVVGDGAPAHRERRVRALGLPLIARSPSRPARPPAARILAGIRRQVEGAVDATLADRPAAVEAYLRALDADPERVRSLAGWDWIHDARTLLAACAWHNQTRLV